MSDFDKYLPKLETIDVKCDKEQLLDYMWLFNNIPWSNHDGKDAKIEFDETIKAYCIMLNGYDTKTAEMKEVEFDNLRVTAFHGIGNSFVFVFKLGDKEVHSTMDYQSFTFDKEETKKRYIDKLEGNIKGLKNQIAYKEDAIKLIKEL